MPAKSRSKNPYGVHPMVGMTRKWVDTMKEKTGRTLGEWLDLLRKSGIEGKKARRTWLREKHGVPTNTAWWLSHKVEEEAAWDDDPKTYLRRAPALVDAMYAGKKAAMRPVYDALLARGLALPGDVLISPCQTMVPFYRKHVFAEILPATNDRVDLGLALGPDVKPTGRLERVPQAAGNRISHRISVRAPAEVDAEVDRWLRAAYERGDGAIARSTAPARTPPELAAGLAKSAKAKATFESLTPRMKHEFVAWIVEAKKADTRARRIERALERLGAGKKTLY